MGNNMARVTGIGGVFIKARDAEKLKDWYRVHLGLDIQAWGTSFQWNDPDGTTAWNVFPATTKYFDPSSASFMINYRVADLRGLLATLRAEGVTVDDKVESSDFGDFGWVMDCEGNRVELWQPPAAKLPG